ncbi:MAG: hypothetical protein K0R31_545, partial [Clostridiales bacterium]|nr:hypothetical protein [Clostridiales bacterium]
MELKRNLKKVIAFAVALCMFVGLMPMQLINVYAGTISVTRAVVYGEYDRYDLKSILVQVTVSGDSGTYAVRYDDGAGVQHSLGD